MCPEAAGLQQTRCQQTRYTGTQLGRSTSNYSKAVNKNMRLSKIVLFAALVSPGLVATAFAQHGGGGHGGGGGHAGGGGRSGGGFSAGGGVRGGSVGGLPWRQRRQRISRRLSRWRPRRHWPRLLVWRPLVRRDGSVSRVWRLSVLWLLRLPVRIRIRPLLLRLRSVRLRRGLCDGTSAAELLVRSELPATELPTATLSSTGLPAPGSRTGWASSGSAAADTASGSRSGRRAVLLDCFHRSHHSGGQRLQGGRRSDLLAGSRQQGTSRTAFKGGRSVQPANQPRP